ncbi:MAG TPA: FkbM family methyltransferase [Acidobacteriaceae bacterium]|nr:FkbM family methyltransferase [Acidobacteriaceae bacterium]
MLRAADTPTWLSIPSVDFPVRGQRITHGLSYAIIGSQERNPASLALACLRLLKFRTFWDIGANFGYYSWLMKSANADLEIMMVEPLPANASLIRETIIRNCFRDVDLTEAAASDAPGRGALHADDISGSTSSLNDEETFEQRHFGIAPRTMPVSLVSIDSLRASRARIDFMKIDVEGHEAATLRGAEATIARDQPVLLVECAHPEHQCLNALDGYTIVDADRLTRSCEEGSANFFCFPKHRSDAIDAVLAKAAEG